MQVDVEGHPIKVGDKVVYNRGKHDNGVRIGVVTKLKGTTQVEIDGDKGPYSMMKKEASYVYLIKS